MWIMVILYQPSRIFLIGTNLRSLKHKTRFNNRSDVLTNQRTKLSKSLNENTGTDKQSNDLNR
jgi:hypothetical protein